MKLLTSVECASVLSNQAPQGSGVRTGAASGYDQYSGVLQLVKTRTEELLEISTLDRHQVTDYYNVRTTGEVTFRLSGGFLVDSDANLRLVDSTGADVDKEVAGVDVDEELGVVTASLYPGRYSIVYTQGFEVDDEDTYKGLPDFLKSIAKAALLSHYRITSMASSTPENVSYGELHAATLREMWAKVSKRYVKPRAMVEFPLRSVING